MSAAGQSHRRSRVWLIAVVVASAGAAYLAARRWRGRSRTARGPVTPALVRREPADHDLGQPGRNLDARLDEALEESFPASDPVSVHIE